MQPKYIAAFRLRLQLEMEFARVIGEALQPLLVTLQSLGVTNGSREGVYIHAPLAQLHRSVLACRFFEGTDA